MSASAQPMHNPPAHQREVDLMMAAARAEAAEGPRPLFKPAPPKAQLSERVLDHRMSEELEVIRRRLDQIGDILASDPVLLHRHAVSLQGLDLTHQVLGHLASVIAAQDKEAAVEQVSLQDLKSRLRRKPIGA